jgi:hypothetical protein
MKIKKEQLKHIYNVLEKEKIGYLQKTLNEWFPELFEVKLEAGKWYNIDRSKEIKDDYKALVFFKGETKKAYGFDHGGVYCNDYGSQSTWSNLNYKITPATESEVKEALINEAIKKYKEGQTLKGVSTGTFKKIDIRIKDSEEFHYYFNRNELYVCGFQIFDNGKWAEIIKEPKKQYVDLHEVIKAFQKANPNTIIICDSGKEM